MLATKAPLPASPAGWAFEVKWDGIRAVAAISPDQVRLTSRLGNDISNRYPELAAMAEATPLPVVLDGEIVAFDADGRPSFQNLQQRMHVQSAGLQHRFAQEIPVTYIVFDLLWVDGHSTIDLPYRQRRELLEQLDVNGPRWRTPTVVFDESAGLLDFAKAHGFEGIVAKAIDSRYEPGRRSRSWIKHVFRSRQELVVGGWLPGEGGRAATIGALLVGHHVPTGDGTPGPLRYVGRVGSGFNDADLGPLRARLEALVVDENPFAEGRPPKGSRFVTPTLVAEVAFSQWTAAGTIRQPSFLGWRDDVDPAWVVREGAAAG